MSQREKEYAYYDKHDNFVDIGTKEELAALTGVKPETIEFYCSPTYRKRTKKGIRVIPLEEKKNETQKKVISYLIDGQERLAVLILSIPVPVAGT
ncbi:MAG: hypothetical protein L0J63_01100 [Tetragenococcus koreensis]|nr:hypothetical protein [Tetragenococcus koreensis]